MEKLLQNNIFLKFLNEFILVPPLEFAMLNMSQIYFIEPQSKVFQMNPRLIVV